MTGLPFGYVLVHKDVYAIMLDALNAREFVLSDLETAGSLPAAAVDTQRGPAESAKIAESPTLSPAVLGACDMYGFGDPQEVALNRRQASQWAALGWTEAEIVRGIRDGGQPALVG